jgi:hypothetical protein
MEIIISDTLTVNEIQAEFQSHFPFLKLEFYLKEHEAGEGNSNLTKVDSKKSLGEIRTKHNDGELSIHGNQKVSTLESNFHDVYGLNVQVFRKNGELWLQTTVTDEWTLSEQNSTAMEHAK